MRSTPRRPGPAAPTRTAGTRSAGAARARSRRVGRLRPGESISRGSIRVGSIPRSTPAVLVVLAACLFVGSPLVAQTPSDYLATRIDARVVVVDRAETADVLVDWAESVDGYFTLRSFDRVELRLPDGIAGPLRKLLDERALDILAFNPQAEDLRQELSRIEAGITSRRESIDRVFDFIETADVAATLAFERELSALLAELESLVGQRRVVEHRIAHTYVSVALSSNRQDIPTTIPSSFEWINEMGLYRFLAEVRR